MSLWVLILLYSQPPVYRIMFSTRCWREEAKWINPFLGFIKVGGRGFQMSIIPAGKVWPQYQDNENEDDDII